MRRLLSSALPALALVVVSVSGPAARPAPARFTIDQVLSAPFPSEMVAAPTGQKVAWAFNLRGARNVWVAEGPDFRPRALTHFTGDNGLDLTGLLWTPDGSAVVFVRGQGTNRQGENPNPSSDPAGGEQSIWIATLAGQTRKLADGSNPAIAPTSDRIAFVQKGQIWQVAVTADAKPEQLIHARGNASSLRWSPNGSMLTFVSGRGTHAFVGIYDKETRAVRFLDPSVDRDSEPVWSPDSAKVAFIRDPADRDRVGFIEQRDGEPWSIRVADAKTAQGLEVWHASRGPGSAFREVVANNQLIWTSDHRIVFPWEADGWTHLYSVPSTGGTAARLTPGAFEVEDVRLAPDGRSILFNSNQDDIDRRHVWRVTADGASKPERVTSGSGIEWSATMTADGNALAFLQSDARKPARPMIEVGGGTPRELAPDTMPSDFPASALVEPEAVTVAAADGLQIPAQLFKPLGSAPAERRPAVIFFHGGSRRQMLLGWNYGFYYHNAYALNQYLASRGYIVLSVNYRSGIGYGMEFREALNYGANGASEFNDVIGAGLYLRNRPDVDPTKIGLWGGSYGGYLTAMGLSRAPHLFAAGVDIHGVHDWNVVIRNFQPAYDPLKREAIARRALESSPMSSLSTWRAPVLVVHGDDDRNVPFSETVDLVEHLRRQNVTVEQLIFPDEVHSFLRHERWVQTYTAAADFFEKFLRGQATTSQ